MSPETINPSDLVYMIKLSKCRGIIIMMDNTYITNCLYDMHNLVTAFWSHTEMTPENYIVIIALGLATCKVIFLQVRFFSLVVIGSMCGWSDQWCTHLPYVGLPDSFACRPNDIVSFLQPFECNPTRDYSKYRDCGDNDMPPYICGGIFRSYNTDHNTCATNRALAH